MKYRAELEIANYLTHDGFKLTDDILQAGLEYVVRELGSYRREVKSSDVKATVIKEVRFRTNIGNFLWQCCDLRSDYWVEASKFFRLWCAYRTDYKGPLTTGRFGKLIKAQFPEIKWDRKMVRGKQVPIYRGVKLRDVYMNEVTDGD